MFIRKTSTSNTATGERYFTYRLATSKRIDGKVKQITLLNLGRQFSLAQEKWPLLCTCIEEIITGHASLIPLEASPAIEKMAARYAEQILLRSRSAAEAAPTSNADAMCEVTKNVEPVTPPSSLHEVDIDSLSLLRPRSVGVEHVGLYAMDKLGLVTLLKEIGLNGVQSAAAIGNIIGRMAAPASERAIWQWLQSTSSLGELLDVDFEGLSHMQIYRASDSLIANRDTIESRLFANIQSLFSLETTVALYDLTNTYFEGEASHNPKAAHGRSKEKRKDCPLVTLALVLDGSGFVRRSQTFAGNVSEGKTLEDMLKGLQAPKGALVIMDRGIATQENLDWLVANGFRYLVCRRGGSRVDCDEQQAISVTAASGDTLTVHKEISANGKEAHLYCHSKAREQKEEAMNKSFMAKFEAGLQKIQDALIKPHGEKRVSKLQERIGRLKEKSHGISQHYTVTLTADEENKERATQLNWEKTPVSGSSLTHPGVYCLSTTETEWSEEKMWKTYTMLTDLEAVFRSLKSELGLRPIYHHTESRVDGHLFITVLAYQCVQMIRTHLAKAGITYSWKTLRDILSVQRRVTASFKQKNGSTLHVRKATLPEAELKAIYVGLGIHYQPGGIKKMVV